MGRAKHKGKRVNGRLSRARLEIVERNPPPAHILARRELFSFVATPKGGNIDQDICDGIGQLHVLGMLSGFGLDPLAMRDAGREFAELWWSRYSATAPKVGKYERADKSSSPFDGETAADRRFARMDLALEGYERDVVMSLVGDLGDEIVPWAAGLIAEALLKRGRVVRFAQFPTCDDRARLAALGRGLIALVDGALPNRREMAA